MQRWLFVLALPVLAQAPLYRDSKAPIDQRVADLVGRMTPDEKIGQLLTPLGWEMWTKQPSSVTVSGKFDQLMRARPVGALWGVERADPWTKRTLKTGLSPRQAAVAANALQKYAVEKTRLGIPLLLAEECPHGHMAIGATVFPTAIGQASAWNPALIHRMGQAIASETRSAGGNVCYGPVLDIAREPRWSRVEETYGEDPYLTAKLGVAFVQGLQGTALNRPDTVISTLKHLAGHGQPEGGHNGGPARMGPRELLTIHLPPFRAAVQAGVRSAMTSYNEIDGVPTTSDHWLLTSLLRDEWGFQGFVVSDLGAIEGLAHSHHVAADIPAAAALALNAGVDSDLGGNAFARLNPSSKALDTAVARVLKAKFELGLFENPYTDPDLSARVNNSKEHRKIALELARQSVVLLKNDGAVLPLSKQISSIAVIGPNADSTYNQLGDYTAPQPAGKVVTVLDGIRAIVPKATVRYARGCSIRTPSTAGIAEAVAAARASDVSVVVLGGSSARDFSTEFEDSGAARPSDKTDMEAGEGFDRETLVPMGSQLELLRQVMAAGKPVVLVLINGRPMTLEGSAEKAPAILEAWYPGEQGGAGIAEIIFGDTNPSGRLPISIPRSVGQLPVHYNGLSTARRPYTDGPATPAYAFGHGLSYTTFKYGELSVKVEPDARVRTELDITNTGSRAGAEVVQLYLRQAVASVTTPVMSLKGFERVDLKPGETRRVVFVLNKDDLRILNREMHWVVEPGAFTVMAGASSADIRQRARFVLGPQAGR
jgi:beta-glucosidase